MDHTPLKRAIVAEGGAMRSAYVAGALLGLQEAGDVDYDLAVGSSAGAIGVANFVAGEAEKNCRILEEELIGPDFIKFKNVPFLKRNVMDMDFLIDEVCKKRIPLAVDKIRQSKTQLFISGTECETGEVYYFNNREHDLFEALRISCAMPYMYRQKLIWQGRRYVDGGLAESVPLMKALAEGANDITVVLSRAWGYRKKKSILRFLNYLFFAHYPQLARALSQRHVSYNRVLDQMVCPPKNVRVRIIAAQAELPVTRITRDPDRVRRAIDMGYEDGRKAADKPN